MQGIIAQILADFVTTALLTVVVLLALMYAFQRHRTPATIRGIFSAIGRILGAPLHFIREVLTELSQRSTDWPGKPGDAQMLTRRLLFTGRLIVVMTALAVVSAGLVRGWHEMVPARDVVDAYHAAVKEKQDLDSMIPVRTAALAHLDSLWNRDSARLVRSYADTLRARIDRDEKAREATRGQLLGRATVAKQQFANLLAALDAEHPGWRDEDQANQFQNLVAQLMGSLKSLDAAKVREFGFEPRDSTLLREYLQTWADQRNAQRLAGRWPTADVRTELQKEHQPLVNELRTSESRRTQLVAELPTRESQAEWRQMSFVLAAAKAILTAFFLVWTGGLLLEVLTLYLDIGVSAVEYFRRGKRTASATAVDHAATEVPVASGV